MASVAMTSAGPTMARGVLKTCGSFGSLVIAVPAGSLAGTLRVLPPGRLDAEAFGRFMLRCDLHGPIDGRLKVNYSLVTARSTHAYFACQTPSRAPRLRRATILSNHETNRRNPPARALRRDRPHGRGLLRQLSGLDGSRPRGVVQVAGLQL